MWCRGRESSDLEAAVFDTVGDCGILGGMQRGRCLRRTVPDREPAFETLLSGLRGRDRALFI